MSSGPEYAPAPQRGDPERRLTVDQRIELIREGLDTWREGFFAYLLSPAVDLADPDMVEHFGDCYAGWYPDRRALAEGQVESLGWKDALDEFRHERSIPEGALDLDWGVIWEHCCEVYTVVERLGGVHAFTR